MKILLEKFERGYFGGTLTSENPMESSTPGIESHPLLFKKLNLLAGNKCNLSISDVIQRHFKGILSPFSVDVAPDKS